MGGRPLGGGRGRRRALATKPAALKLTDVHFPRYIHSTPYHPSGTEAFDAGAFPETERTDSVVVTVVRVSGDKVRIGIEAPANVRVLRDELETESLGTVTLEPTAELPIPRLFGFVG